MPRGTFLESHFDYIKEIDILQLPWSKRAAYKPDKH